MGEWMRRHSRSIHGCTQAPKEFPEPTDCRYTYNPKTSRLYVHVYAWPYKFLHLPGLRGKVAYAQLLGDGSEVPAQELSEDELARLEDSFEDVLSISLPVKQPDVTVPVLELFLK